jgi:hypothetical protein
MRGDTSSKVASFEDAALDAVWKREKRAAEALAQSERRKHRLRTLLLDMVAKGTATPEGAEQQAAKRGLGAFSRKPDAADPRFDPMEMERWSVPMALAWIMWGTRAAVREHCDAYRAECWEWVARTYEELPDIRVQAGDGGGRRTGIFVSGYRLEQLGRATLLDLDAAAQAESHGAPARFGAALRLPLDTALRELVNLGARDALRGTDGVNAAIDRKEDIGPGTWNRLRFADVPKREFPVWTSGMGVPRLFDIQIPAAPLRESIKLASACQSAPNDLPLDETKTPAVRRKVGPKSAGVMKAVDELWGGDLSRAPPIIKLRDKAIMEHMIAAGFPATGPGGEPITALQIRRALRSHE